MKRVIQFFLAIGLLLVGFHLFSSSPVSAYTEVSISSGENIQIATGVPFEVPVYIEDASEVSGFQFRFLYDDTKFMVQSIIKNPNLPSSLVYNIDNLGVIQLNYADISSLIYGYTELFTVTFVPYSGLSFGYHSILSIDQSYLNQVTYMDSFYNVYTVDYINYYFPLVRSGVFGDVNGDGLVTIMDVNLIQLYLAGIRSFSSEELYLADVSGDGIVTILDVNFIQLYLAGRKTDLDPNPPTTFTVTFDSRGGSFVPSQTVSPNGYVQYPDDPVREGYEFQGWMVEPEVWNEYPLWMPITSNVTVYAYWTSIPLEIISLEEAINTENNTRIRIAGIITAINGSSIYITDYERGFMIYNLPSHYFSLYDIKPGKHIEVEGNKGTFMDVPQIDQTYDLWVSNWTSEVPLAIQGTSLHIDYLRLYLSELMSFDSLTIVQLNIPYDRTSFFIKLTDDVLEIDVHVAIHNVNYDSIVAYLSSFEVGDQVAIQDMIVSSANSSQLLWISPYNMVHVGTLDGDALRVGVMGVYDSFLPMFALGQGDTMVEELLFAYSTVVTDRYGKQIVNPTAIENDFLSSKTVDPITENETYTFQIHEDLYWSNGVQITAKDYITAILLNGSVDSNNYYRWAYSPYGITYYHIVGFDQYYSDSSNTSENVYFSGLRLIDDFTFSVTLSNNNTTTYGDLSYLNFTPVPAHLLLPSNTVITSDENGVKISTGGFAKLGYYYETYNKFPVVTSGPYNYLGMIQGAYHFVSNPYYKGNYEGVIPSIERVIVKNYEYSVNGSDLMLGYLDLIPMGVGLTQMQSILDLQGFIADSFLTGGYASLTFHCDFGPVADENVRLAIAHLINREEAFINNQIGFTGTNALAPYFENGYEYLTAISSVSNFNYQYGVNPVLANALLDNSEYKYESDGVTLFDPNIAASLNIGLPEDWTYIRHNAQQEPLVFKVLSAAAWLQQAATEEFTNNFASVGILPQVTMINFYEMIDHFYSPGIYSEREYHAFLLTKTHAELTDYNSLYHSGSIYEYGPNLSRLNDSMIDSILADLMSVEPNQEELYMELWKDLMLRLNSIVPEIPLSNRLGFTYRSIDVSEVDRTRSYSWIDALHYLQLARTPSITINDGISSIYTVIKAFPGEPITLPTPINPGFDFLGWFIDEDMTIPVDFTTMPEVSMTVYAKYIYEYSDSTFTVGVSTLNPLFMYGTYSQNANIAILKLLYGYETMAVTEYGQFVPNPTVLSNASTFFEEAFEFEQDFGNGLATHTAYTFRLNDNLYFSDGMPITARDYVFTILLLRSSAWSYFYGNHTMYSNIVGDADYRNNYNNLYSGIQILDDYTFTIVLDGTQTREFFDVQYLEFIPLPFHRFNLNEIISNQYGTFYIGDMWSLINDYWSLIETPYITSGPYKIRELEEDTLHLIINPYYIGNYMGDVPTIYNIIIKRIDNINDMNYILDGVVDYIPNVTSIFAIDIAEELYNLTYNSWYRNGTGILAFNTDFGPTQDEFVRYAIASLTDRLTLIEELLYNRGIYVNGMYTEDWWANKLYLYTHDLESIEMYLNSFDFSIEQANAYLDLTEWIYESDGITLFDPALALTMNSGSYETQTYFRHNTNGELLQINHMGTYNNVFTDFLVGQFEELFALAGIRYTANYGDFYQLSDHYYYSADLKYQQEDGRIYHMFNLALNYGNFFQPYYQLHSDFFDTWMNPWGVNDSAMNPMIPLEDGELTLDEITLLMLDCEVGDSESYMEYWYLFQLRWNKILPYVPLYSNAYYDVYSSDFGSLPITPFWTWGHAVYYIELQR